MMFVRFALSGLANTDKKKSPGWFVTNQPGDVPCETGFSNLVDHFSRKRSDRASLVTGVGSDRSSRDNRPGDLRSAGREPGSVFRTRRRWPGTFRAVRCCGPCRRRRNRLLPHRRLRHHHRASDRRPGPCAMFGNWGSASDRFRIPARHTSAGPRRNVRIRHRSQHMQSFCLCNSSSFSTGATCGDVHGGSVGRAAN